MRIIDVIPIARGVPKETLTYFTTLEADAGALVEILMRTRSIPALVVRSTDAEESKSELRSAPYAIKKLTRIISPHFLSPPFLNAVRETAEYYAGTTGATLASLIPVSLLEEIVGTVPAILTTEPPPPADGAHLTGGVTPERLAIQASDEERFSHYKSVIRGEFAKKRSVYMVLPTIEEAKRAVRTLEKGIETYTILLHGNLKKKEAATLFEKIASEKHAMLIVGTASFLMVPRTDVGVYIVERESSPAYKLPARPFADVRFFVERLATHTRSTLVLGDVLLRIETAERVERGELAELAPLKWRPLFSATLEIADVRPPRLEQPAAPAPRKKREFKVFGEALSSLIAQTQAESARMILFSSRKGLSPTTVCEDCGTTVECKRCSAPVVLHLGDPSEEAGNVFVCNRCGTKRTAAERCIKCDGWRLVPLGIGIERVVEELHERFPRLSVFQIDKEATKTAGAAQRVAEQFRDTPGSVLVGTELALLYADTPVEYTAVASMDSLFALPDFRISEKALGILLRLRALAGRKMIVQTRMPDTPILERARLGSLIDFYREEATARKDLGYPPYRLLIKISAEGKRDAIYEKMVALKDELTTPKNGISAFDLEIFPAFIRTVKGKFMLHGLLRLSPATWPDPGLRSLLLSLPSDFTVRVDPESLL